MIQNNSKILVPFDSTELSIKALDRACEVALNTSSELIMLYVVDTACLCPGRIREHIKDMNKFETARTLYVEELKRAAEQMMQDRWKELNRRGIKVTPFVKTGDPADEILNLARDEMVHAIIMGSSGSLKRLHERKGIGSISRWISEIANCPVILMR
jgi:nucleotide-binding universal stress UspA family protein